MLQDRLTVRPVKSGSIAILFTTPSSTVIEYLRERERGGDWNVSVCVCLSLSYLFDLTFPSIGVASKATSIACFRNIIS